MSKVSHGPKYRVQLDFASKDFAEIERLVETPKLPTRVDAFGEASLNLIWKVQKKLGCTIIAEAPNDCLSDVEPRKSAHAFGSTNYAANPHGGKG